MVESKDDDNITIIWADRKRQAGYIKEQGVDGMPVMWKIITKNGWTSDLN